jgi:hypothetical protein
MKTTRQLKKEVLKKYPNAVNLILGSNNIVNGIWFELPNAKLRHFIPAS